MATGGQTSPSQPKGLDTSPTDCPDCGSLCLGPCVLPCGHFTCRRCLQDLLHRPGQSALCRQCGQQVILHSDQELTINQLVRQMGTDPVLEQMVWEEMEKDRDLRCLHCPNKQAVKVCVDCQEYYCEPCSANHRRSRLSKDHDLLLLPQGFQNAPSVAQVTCRHRSDSVTSTLSLDSIRNVDDSQSHDLSRDEEEWREWVRKEVGLLQQASSKQLEVKNTLEDIRSEVQQLLDSVHVHQQILDTYIHQLPRLAFTQCTDPGTYVISVRSSDVSMAVKTEFLKRRLCDVRKCRQSPDVKAVKKIRTQLTQLFHCSDQDKNSGTTPVTPATSLVPSSTPSTPSSIPSTPSSAPLPPSSQPATPTFTPRVDLMTAVPRQVFRASPRTADDSEVPYITAIVSLPDDRLVMADGNNSKVKVMETAAPHAVSASLELPERPRRLALLPDGLVAVTTFNPVIYLLRVTDTVTVTSRIETDRHYVGLAGHSEGHLIASCGISGTRPAAVDLLTRQGNVLRTLTDSSRLPQLTSPHNICHAGDEHHILLSDWRTDVVHELDIRTGDLVQTFHHADMTRPRQLCVDEAGNMLVASRIGQCVMVRDREGQWRRLVTAMEHSDPGFEWCCGMCLTSSGHLVVGWASPRDRNSVVISYKLT